MALEAQDRGGISLGHESLGSILTLLENIPAALNQYRQVTEMAKTGTGEDRGYAALHYADALWRLGRYREAAAQFEIVAAAGAKFPALIPRLARSRARMALSQGLPAEAEKETRRVAATGSAGIELDLTRCLALTELGRAAQGRALCEASLKKLAEAEGPDDLFRARMIALEAALKARDTRGALRLYGYMEEALPSHPESRWRALGLLAATGVKDGASARAALQDLAQLWGEPAYKGYLTRPDIAALARPFLEPKAAIPNRGEK